MAAYMNERAFGISAANRADGLKFSWTEKRAIHEISIIIDPGRK
jgi:hypothetical protein